jgi:phosphoribosylformimino-5-aminoimidazole carboxamide ribotide isomerase
MDLRIYPVIDLLGGVAVRGVGGDRARYRPVRSVLAASPRPLAVARAVRARLGLERLYVADLDAIAGAPPSAAVLRSLASDGFRLLVDAGCRSAADAVSLLGSGAEEVIAPLETLPGPSALAEILEAAGASRVVFSLDMKAGALLGRSTAWPSGGAMGVAREAHRLGARRLLVLDLAKVGSGTGPGHFDLIRAIRERFPGVEVLAGGGVRSAADLRALAEAGAHAALVASALHDGAIASLP